jgi:hypothetical protein
MLVMKPSLLLGPENTNGRNHPEICQPNEKKVTYFLWLFSEINLAVYRSRPGSQSQHLFHLLGWVLVRGGFLRQSSLWTFGDWIFRSNSAFRCSRRTPVNK